MEATMNPRKPLNRSSQGRRSLYLHILDTPRLYQRCVVKWLQSEKGHALLRQNFQSVIGLLSQESMSLTKLAEKTGLRKQHCARLVNSMEAAGYIRRKQSESDRRVQELSLSRKGHNFIRDGIEFSNTVGQHLLLIFGDTGLRELHVDLITLCREFNLSSPYYGEIQSEIQSNDLLIIRMIALADFCSDYANKRIRMQGYPDIRPKHGQVMLHIGARSVCVQELALALDLSKQTISGTVTELVKLGYINLESNAGDRRSNVIKLSRRGRDMFDVALRVVERLMADIEKLLGKERIESFQVRMSAVYNFLSSYQIDSDTVSNQQDARKNVASFGDIAIYLLALLADREQKLLGNEQYDSEGNPLLQQLLSVARNASKSVETIQSEVDACLSEQQRKFLHATLWNLASPTASVND